MSNWLFSSCCQGTRMDLDLSSPCLFELDSKNWICRTFSRWCLPQTFWVKKQLGVLRLNAQNTKRNCVALSVRFYWMSNVTFRLVLQKRQRRRLNRFMRKCHASLQLPYLIPNKEIFPSFISHLTEEFIAGVKM